MACCIFVQLEVHRLNKSLEDMNHKYSQQVIDLEGEVEELKLNLKDCEVEMSSLKEVLQSRDHDIQDLLTELEKVKEDNGRMEKVVSSLKVKHRLPLDPFRRLL